MNSLRELIKSLVKQIEILQAEEDLENPPHKHFWEDGKSVTYGYEHYGTVYSCKCGAFKEVDRP